VASRSYYTAIAGSRDLYTESVADTALLARFESLPGRERRALAWCDEELTTGLVHGSVVSIPRDAFDGLARRLCAEEQAAYFQLWRLAFGEGRNFCRVGKRDLQRRLSLSERHLNRILDGLVRKGAIRPLQRNNFGTLYRVRTPDEMDAVAAAPTELASAVVHAVAWARS
jgi:hypothetical protein